MSSFLGRSKCSSLTSKVEKALITVFKTVRQFVGVHINVPFIILSLSETRRSTQGVSRPRSYHTSLALKYFLTGTVVVNTYPPIVVLTRLRLNAVSGLLMVGVIRSKTSKDVSPGFDPNLRGRIYKGESGYLVINLHPVRPFLVLELFSPRDTVLVRDFHDCRLLTDGYPEGRQLRCSRSNFLLIV